MPGRIKIEKLLNSGHPQKMITAQLGCHRSTISQERKVRSWSPERSHSNPRSSCAKSTPMSYRMSYDSLVRSVLSNLRDGWTPDEIGGRLPHGFPADPRTRGSAGKPRMSVFMGRVVERFTLTGSDGLCQSMTAPWTSNPEPLLGIGHQTALLVQVTLVEYTPARGANSGFCALRRSPRKRASGLARAVSNVFPSASPWALLCDRG
jgi:hypothetical protein